MVRVLPSLFVWFEVANQPTTCRHANLRGPKDTPYAAINFHVILTFPATYPVEPPKVIPCTELDHPNVFGDYICLDLLEAGQWSTSLEKNKKYTVGCPILYCVVSIAED